MLGTEADKNAAQIINNLCKGKVLDLTGNTKLSEAMAVINLSDVFITNDSGLMHVGAALKTPMVAIFGSTKSLNRLC